LRATFHFNQVRKLNGAIRQLGYDSKSFDVGSDFVDEFLSYSADVAFCAFHGAPGETGELQGLLEVIGMPYTHSGVLATALAMDKHRSKAVLRDLDLPVPNGKLARKSEIEAGHQLSVPYVIKPNVGGSSLGGLYLVSDLDQPPPKLLDGHDGIFIVEEFIEGHELTVSVLGDRALAASQFQIHGLYDYAAKYECDGSNHVLPALVPKEIEERLFKYAVDTHRALNCRGLTRTDFRWNEALGVDGLFILETNTHPGFRRDSNSGEHAAH
jgi:D-alanine-D-alanine ligase